MGIKASLTFSLLGAALVVSQPAPASAQSGPAWDTCIGTATKPDERVSACTAVIDAKIDAKIDVKSERAKKLAVAYCNRGHGLTEQRELDRALADLDEAIRIDPGFALAYNNRGDAWLGKGDDERALADFNAAIKHNPSLAIAYGNRGYLYYRKRDMARAIADYTTQIRLAPDVLAYVNRGNAYRDSEQLDRAAGDYAEVTKLAPADARGWRNRGMIRLYQGDNKGGFPTTTRRCNTIPPTCFPGTTAARPNYGSATSRARSRIFGRRWSFVPICAPRAKACSSLGRRNSHRTGALRF